MRVGRWLVGMQAILALACSALPSEHTANVRDYSVILVDTAANHYVSCPQYYCLVTAPDSTRDSMTVHLNLDSTAAAGFLPSHSIDGSNGVVLKGTFSSTAAGILNVDVNTYQSVGCAAVSLRADQSNFAGGSFVEQMDCHGATRWGRFTAIRYLPR